MQNNFKFVPNQYEAGVSSMDFSFDQENADYQTGQEE